MVEGRKRLPGQPLHPLHHAVQICTDASNEGRGAHLGDYTKGWLVRSRKQAAYQLSGIKGSLVGPQGVRTPLPGSGLATDNTTVVAYINKEGGMRPGSPVCSPMETPVLVQSQGNLPESMSHSGQAQCDSRQTVQTPAGHADGMVPAPGGLCSDLSQVAPSQSGLVCDQVQLQAASVRVPSPRHDSLDSGCPESVLGEP